MWLCAFNSTEYVNVRCANKNPTAYSRGQHLKIGCSQLDYATSLRRGTEVCYKLSEGMRCIELITFKVGPIPLLECLCFGGLHGLNLVLGHWVVAFRADTG
eukprot:PhM_4_TR2120/c1_g1_i3/m.3158